MKTYKEKLEKKADLYEQNFFRNSLIKRWFSLLFKPNTPPRYLMIKRYPKDARKFLDLGNLDVYSGLENVGIVLQGPICKNDAFTIKTVDLYRYLYPDIHIVISTWEGELSEQEKSSLKNLRCDIVESPGFPLAYKGKGKKPGSANNQLCSSLAGIKYLKKKKCEYVLKNRTDVGIYKPDIIPYFLNLLKLFPVAHTNLHNRLLAVSFSNMLINVPFHMSDFIWFGQMSDIEKLYGIPKATEEDFAYIREKNMDLVFLADYEKKFHEAMEKTYLHGDIYHWWDKLCLDERFLLTNHEEALIAFRLYQQIYDNDRSGNLLYQYHDFIKKCMVIIDEDSISAYHNKDSAWNFQSNVLLQQCGRLTHSTWINMVANGI